MNKVCVLNFSGNVGKTTVAGHMLKPRMDDATIYSIESLNMDAAADGHTVERMKGKFYGDLQEQLMQSDNAIVDVGASNVEEFLDLMQRYEGSHDEFDYFLIPIVKEKKVQADTVNTIRALHKMGIAKSKIRVVFNKVETDDDLEREFSALFALHETEKSFTLRPDAVIHTNEVYELLKGVGKSLGEVTADPIDYREQLRSAKTEDEKMFCVRMVSLKRLAITANKNLDETFKVIFKK